jgi:hypothetical protein
VGLRTGLYDVERKKFLALAGIELDPSAVQPLASRYTDYVFLPLFLSWYNYKIPKSFLKIICLFFVMISVEGNPKVRKQGQNKA